MREQLSKLIALGIDRGTAEVFLIGAEMAARSTTQPNIEVVGNAISNLHVDGDVVERLRYVTETAETGEWPGPPMPSFEETTDLGEVKTAVENVASCLRGRVEHVRAIEGPRGAYTEETLDAVACSVKVLDAITSGIIDEPCTDPDPGDPVLDAVKADTAAADETMVKRIQAGEFDPPATTRLARPTELGQFLTETRFAVESIRVSLEEALEHDPDSLVDSVKNVVGVLGAIETAVEAAHSGLGRVRVLLEPDGAISMKPPPSDELVDVIETVLTVNDDVATLLEAKGVTKDDVERLCDKARHPDKRGRVPDAAEFSWGGGVMGFDAEDGEGLCNVDGKLVKRVAEWAIERGLVAAPTPVPESVREVAAHNAAIEWCAKTMEELVPKSPGHEAIDDWMKKVADHFRSTLRSFSNTELDVEAWLLKVKREAELELGALRYVQRTNSFGKDGWTVSFVFAQKGKAVPPRLTPPKPVEFTPKTPPRIMYKLFTDDRGFEVLLAMAPRGAGPIEVESREVLAEIEAEGGWSRVGHTVPPVIYHADGVEEHHLAPVVIYAFRRVRHGNEEQPR